MTPEMRIAGITLVALAATLALGACQAEKKTATQGTAGGEVLEASVSDAMLPVDTVRSQPPLAPKVQPSGKAPTSAKPGASASKAADVGDAPEEPPAEAPKAEPTAAE